MTDATGYEYATDLDIAGFEADYEALLASGEEPSEGSGGADPLSLAASIRSVGPSLLAAVSGPLVTADMVAVAVAVAKRLAVGPYGYGQDDRWGALADSGKLGLDGLSKLGDADCSSSTGMIYYLAGIISRPLLRGTWYTGNGVSKLRSTGRFDVISVSSWSLSRLTSELRKGDSVWGLGHVVFAVDDEGTVLSFEATESGGKVGGKAGDQTGREGRLRKIYSRSRGWSFIVRPRVADSSFIVNASTYTLINENIRQARVKGGPARLWPFDTKTRSAAVKVLTSGGLDDIYLVTEASSSMRKRVRSSLPGGNARWGYKNDDHGNVVYYDRTKWTCNDSTVQRIDFTATHGAILATLRHRTTGQKVSVACYHLPPNSLVSERVQQKGIARVVSLLKMKPGIRYLGGDGMDSVAWAGETYKDARKYADARVNDPDTWQNRAITDRIGTLTAYPKTSCTRYEVVDIKESATASDHKRVKARYRINR